MSNDTPQFLLTHDKYVLANVAADFVKESLVKVLVSAEDLIRIRTAAKIKGCTMDEVRGWVEQKRIRGIKLDGTVYVLRSEIRELTLRGRKPGSSRNRTPLKVSGEGKANNLQPVE